MVTQYTSFVAVDRTRVVQPGGATKLVEQPALVPAGVNLANAVGEAPSYAASTYTPSSSEGRSYSGGGWSGGSRRAW